MRYYILKKQTDEKRTIVTTNIYELKGIGSKYVKQWLRKLKCTSEIKNSIYFGWVPVIPALWEARLGRSPDVRNLRPA